MTAHRPHDLDSAYNAWVFAIGLRYCPRCTRQNTPASPARWRRTGTASATSALELERTERTSSTGICDFLRAAGFVRARTGRVRIHSLVVSDPSPWARQPSKTCRPRARPDPSARLNSLHRDVQVPRSTGMCESGHRTNHKSPTVGYLANSSIRGFDSPIGSPNSGI